jgi:kynurenine formamidase
MENNKSVTAVDWLVDELILEGFNVPKVFYDKAKEMEREQIIKAWNIRAKIDGVLTYTDNRTAEQYYNETYESKTNL